MMLAREVQEQCRFFGRRGGTAFDDRELAPAPIVKIVSLNIYHARLVDAIQATYFLEDGSIWTAPKHGGDGGSLSQCVFEPDETITAILLTSGDYIDSIQIVTQLYGTYKRYGPYGGNGDRAGSIIGAIVSLYGRSGKRMDALGVWGYLPIVTAYSMPQVTVVT